MAKRAGSLQEETLEFLGGKRRAEEKSLHFATAVLLKNPRLFSGLDTFGDDPQLETPGYDDHGLRDSGVAGV